MCACASGKFSDVQSAVKYAMCLAHIGGFAFEEQATNCALELPSNGTGSYLPTTLALLLSAGEGRTCSEHMPWNVIVLC